MPTWQMSNFQDSNSPISESFMQFHDMIMTLILSITSLIMMNMMFILINKNINRFFLHGHTIEIIWTITPMMILLYLAMPSIKILYMSDELIKPTFSIKSIGHQWYWSYEYNDLNKNINFDSYMMPYEKNNFRLLDTDNRMILPFNTYIRLLTTSTDVIHSWTIPSLGVKLDSTPGRLNQTQLFLNRPGIFFGQCSEICGANHSFMPIMVESTNMKFFMKWLNKQ